MRGTASRAPIARRASALTDFRKLRVCSRVRPFQKLFHRTFWAKNAYRNKNLSGFIFLYFLLPRRTDSMKCAVSSGHLAAQSTTNIPPTMASGNLSCRSEAANNCNRVTSVACDTWSNGKTFSRRRDAITRTTFLRPLSCLRRIFCCCLRCASLSPLLLADPVPSIGRLFRVFMWNRLECCYVSRGAGSLSRNGCGNAQLFQLLVFKKIPNRYRGNHTRQTSGATTRHKPGQEARWSRCGSCSLHADIDTACGR